MLKEHKEEKSIIFDLDKTLCSKKKLNESYMDVKPIKPMINLLNKLHDEGYFIIIESARNMVTQCNDEGRVIQNIGEDTLRWLRENNVKYDSIKFGKSYGIMYVDDKAIRPSELYKYNIDGIKKIIEEEDKFIKKMIEGEIN